ncbi:MAG TPA: hypothetical protein VKF15_03105 [Nitrososphaerales archaeon]|nr:hypothetical protein [Nitrososphaerales archaeon]
MLSVRRRTYAVASASVFAVLYAVLGLFPVSAIIGAGGFLTFREVVSPLAGMLFGPLVGGASMVLGNFVDFAMGKPVVFDFLDFIPDMVSAVVAGLAFTGQRKAAVGIPVLLLAWFSLDPYSAVVVSVGGVAVPYLWMHVVSLGVLSVALLYEGRGKLGRLAPAFVGAVTFASTMSGHVAGGIMYENVFFRLDGVIPAEGLQGFWTLAFYAYPFERILFTVLGTMVAYPVLRAIARRH